VSQSTRMGAEVGQIAPEIGKICGCAVCGQGIAIDAVGERYGCAPWDGWRCGRTGCEVSAKGLSEAQTKAVREVVAALPEAEVSVPPAPADCAETRLPPERDDEAEARP
jgi:hypothetical protein